MNLYRRILTPLLFWLLLSIVVMHGSDKKPILLTDQVKQWISNHPVIRIGVDPGFAPFEFIDESGEYGGIASDYVTLLGEMYNIKMEVIPDLEWTEVISWSKIKEIDLLPCVGITEERTQYLLYSNSYITFYRAIITRDDYSFISNLHNLEDKKVAVQENSSHHGYLKENSPITPRLYETFQQTLVAVSTGEADACIGNATVAAYYISKYGLNNLKIAAPVSSDNFTLHFAIRNDWPEMVSLINKGLDSISRAQKVTISIRWIPVNIESNFDWTTFWRVLTIIIFVMLIIVGSILFWNRKLSGEIKLRQIVESELRQLTTAVDQSASSIIITDLEGNITYVNPSFLELTGYAKEEVNGKNPRMLQSGETAESLYKELWNTITSGNIWKGDFHNKKKSGQIYWESATIAPVKNKNGQITNFIAIKDDITDRIKMEHALMKSNEATEEARLTLVGLLEEVSQAKMEAETASQYKSEFLANMSHDIRTPLSAVIGMTDLLLDTEAKKERRQKLVLIKESGETLLNIINDILDLSKIESGKIVIEEKIFSIHTLLQSIYDTYSFNANVSGLALILKIDPGTPEFFCGDKLRLNQIITNLVGNALKFTHVGSITMSCGYSNNQLIISLSDTGIGILEEKLDAIFSAFEQADVSTTRQYGGTGLGLAISSNLTRLMHGTISVKSTVKQGSTFTVTIPLRMSTDDEITNYQDKVRQHKETAQSRQIETMVNRWINRLSTQSEYLKTLYLTLSLLDGKITKLGNAINTGDYKQIFHLSYSIKGDTRSVGMIEIADLVEDIELICESKTPDIEEISSIFNLLQTIVNSIPDSYKKIDIENIKQAGNNGRNRSHLKILLAEDTLVNQLMIKEMLLGMGFVCDIAGNGKIALDKLSREKCDVLLLDMHMPVLDGLAVIQEIRIERENFDIKIIALTANAQEDDKQRYLDLGCNNYLSKPIDRVKLEQLLQKYLDDLTGEEQ